MSPKPRLKGSAQRPSAHASPGVTADPDDRIQVMLSYEVTDVPGRDAKSLVRQARDAWVKRGYKFQSSDANWSQSFPIVNMRTEPDDFWMDAITGVVDREKGKGLATITVASPCFAPSNSSPVGRA